MAVLKNRRVLNKKANKNTKSYLLKFALGCQTGLGMFLPIGKKSYEQFLCI